MKPTAPRSMRSRLIAVFILAFMLLPANLMALGSLTSAKAVTFKILDAARYHYSDRTYLKVEITDSTDSDFLPGRHLYVSVILSPESRIKIGQTLKADFSGRWNQLGQLDAYFRPDTAVIVDDNPSCVEIPWLNSPVFEFLFLPISFILFWWLVVILLVYKKGTIPAEFYSSGV